MHLDDMGPHESKHMCTRIKSQGKRSISIHGSTGNEHLHHGITSTAEIHNWPPISQNSSMGSALGIDRSTPPTGVTRVSNNEPANKCQEYICRLPPHWPPISQNSSMGSALGIDRSTPPTGVTRVSNNEPANICQEYI